MPVITKYAATGQAAGGVFNGSWTNPNNVASDNTVYATAAPGKNQEYASVFPIAFTTGEVPAGATINSALVEVQVKCSTTSSVGVVTSSLFADSSQATAIGATPGVQTPVTEPTVDTTFSFTRNPTEAQIRDLWVRVQGTRGNSNTALTWSLDFVRVTVNYTDPPPATTGSGGVSALPASFSASAVERFTGSGALSSLAPNASATGESASAPGFAGTGEVSVPPSTLAAQGALRLTATGAVSAPRGSVSGQAAMRFVGSGALTAKLANLSGTSSMRFLATGSAAVLGPEAVGQGAVVVAGEVNASGALVASRASLAATGTVTNPNPQPRPARAHRIIRHQAGPLKITRVKRSRE